jgi:hypothetical protein
VVQAFPRIDSPPVDGEDAEPLLPWPLHSTTARAASPPAMAPKKAEALSAPQPQSDTGLRETVVQPSTPSWRQHQSSAIHAGGQVSEWQQPQGASGLGASTASGLPQSCDVSDWQPFDVWNPGTFSGGKVTAQAGSGTQ